ncbi:MAG: MerR family transcriptional regulator [Eubacteriales bacterium]
MKDYFTTGEFAKLCKVKKQTLFHYDDIKILKPEFIADNGYRYYSYKQLEEFTMISMLKNLGMSLNQIKDYVDKRSPENLILLLEKESVEVEKKIEELKWVKHYIETKLKITKAAMNVEYGCISTEECKGEYFVATEYSGPENEKDIVEAITKHMNYCHDIDLYSAYAIGGMVPVDDIKLKNEYRYSHFYTCLDEKGYCHTHIKPAGTYLVCCDPEGYKNVEKMAKNMLAYCKQRSWNVGKYFYEDAILDTLAGKDANNYSVKLSLLLL